MSDALARRGFLRSLATLPLIGGGVTLLGHPTAAAEPVTERLLQTYATWLDLERRQLNWERAGEDGETWRALQGTLWFDNPAGCFHGLDGPAPSTRAAVVLSAVGCHWREGF